MNYTIHLRNTQTGQTHIHRENAKGDSELVAAWIHGNFGCDCNRSSLFPDGKELECNHGANVIVIDRIMREDGSLVPLDAVA